MKKKRSKKEPRFMTPVNTEKTVNSYAPNETDIHKGRRSV